MATIEQSVEIRAPIEIVFAAVTDPHRGPEWNPNILDVDGLSEYPVRTGTTWRQVTSVMGRRMNLLCRVTQLHPPFDGLLEISGDQKARIWTACRSEGDVTRVTQRVEFTAPGGILGRAAAELMKGRLEGELRDTLVRQKAVLERERTQPL